MNAALFVPLLVVNHAYFGGALLDLQAFVWAGNEAQLKRLAPRLVVIQGVVGFRLTRLPTTGPSLSDMCARLRDLPIFGWEMVPTAADFAAYTEWPYSLSQQHPLLALSGQKDLPPPASSPRPLRWSAGPLKRNGQHLAPALPGTEVSSDELAEAWGATQERILARARPTFSAFTTGAQVAAIIEGLSARTALQPTIPEAEWPATRAHWAYHIFGYKALRDLIVDENDASPGEPATFVDFVAEKLPGARSFISRQPQPFRARSAHPFRLRAQGRDLISALPVPAPFPLRLGPDEQPVADVFVHL